MRVLLICPSFRWYATSFENGFTLNGCSVRLLISHLGPKPLNILTRAKIKLGYSIDDFLKEKHDRFNVEAVTAFQEFQPDLVFVVLGTQLSQETLLFMGRSAKLVVFLSDTIAYYNDILKTIKLYDLVYTYEETDIQVLGSLGIDARLQMGMYDPRHYYPIPLAKDIDVSFVGKMYLERVQILERLIEDLPDLRYAFYGRYVGLHEPVKYAKRLFNVKRRSAFTNKNIHYMITNQVYNRSKICLNIHCAQTKVGYSSRVPEILGTRSFQLVDHNEAITAALHGSVVTYTSYEDLLDKIRYYVEHESERAVIARAGHERVTQRDTFCVVVNKILSDIRSLKRM